MELVETTTVKSTISWLQGNKIIQSWSGTKILVMTNIRKSNILRLMPVKSGSLVRKTNALYVIVTSTLLYFSNKVFIHIKTKEFSKWEMRPCWNSWEIITNTTKPKATFTPPSSAAPSSTVFKTTTLTPDSTLKGNYDWCELNYLAFCWYRQQPVLLRDGRILSIWRMES